MAAEMSRMVEIAVADGLLATGTSPAVLRAAPRDLAVLRRKNGHHDTKPNSNRWTEEEQAFVRETLGYLGPDEIAAALGRSRIAIKILYTRKGWPAPSKQPHELTAHRIAVLMRKCTKTICHLVDLGILPGRIMPGSLRKIHLVRRVTFERWLVNPANWIYFDHRRMADRRLRRLVELAKSRWPDEWLTTGQAARLMGLKNSKCFNTRIRMRKLKTARRWANWHILRSEVEGLHIRRGKGGPGQSRGIWTERGDEALQFFVAEGKGWREIGRLMGPRYGEKRAPYRYACLQRRWAPSSRRREA